MAKKSVNFLPSFFRTDKNSKFLSSTLDQFIDTPKLERIDGYIGSNLSKNYNPSADRYISDPMPLRRKYQLEPGLVVKTLNGAIAKAYGYDDLINQLSYHGSNTSNLNNLFEPEFLSFDPQIDWDKLINFREYYWLPTGPSAIKITGTRRELTSTYTVGDSQDKNFFVFSPDGLTENPQLVLYRGVTYVFNVKSLHTFYINKSPIRGAIDLYEDDITGNGTNNGQIVLHVSYTAPNLLYYSSNNDQLPGGKFIIKTIDENSSINVETEILGKSQYISSNGVKFINGLKVNFGGDVNPSKYRDKDFIVEGVGNTISLVDFSLLDTPEIFAAKKDVDFDSENFDNFPFDNFKNVPIDPSYITINRASKDLNPWTRYNRWFHADILKELAKLRNEDVILPLTQRATRPIIEFKPNLQLYNFGTQAVANVDLIDNFTTDVFSNIEKSVGYYVDEILVEEGFRILFNADSDPLVQGKIYEIQFVVINGEKKINLVETEDNIPEINSCVTITRGTESAGTVWWLTTVDGKRKWVNGQQKTTLNQPPLFDIFDKNGYSYSTTPYTSNFRGNQIFGYAVGTGTPDTVLGFPLKYQTTGLESSYLFQNYFNTANINRVFPDISITIPVSTGFLKINDEHDKPVYRNIWIEAEDYKIPVIQFQDTFDAVNSVEITVFDNPANLTDLKIDVFVNDIKYSNNQFNLVTDNTKLFVSFVDVIPALAAGNRIKFELYSSTACNETGTYQTPINLTNNPLNGSVSELTLSELYDHVHTMISRDPNFTGSFPGSCNLSSLSTASKYGTRIIVNKNSLAFSHYFISNKDNNIIEAIKSAADDYDQFKLSLIKVLGESADQGKPHLNLDAALIKLNENKTTSFPYFLTGMVPYGTNKKTRNYTVTDKRNTAYSITEIFNPVVVSNKAILVYHTPVNGPTLQLIFEKDYVFDLYDTTVILNIVLVKGDQITIEEYQNTDGCYVPPTPTKLGLYPKYSPEKYQDTTLANEAQYVLQGHDGSIIIAFGDYRDDAILEFEKRIFNNIKTNYNPELFNIHEVLPSVFRKQDFSYFDIYSLIQGKFLKWTGHHGLDFESNDTYDVNNHKTYNYSSAVDSIFDYGIPGNWRAIFKLYFDTDRPDTHPWEMLGMSIKPDWWDIEYGPAPYTSGNKQLWDDLEAGRIANGPNKGLHPTYKRTGLSTIIPVDENGNVVDIRTWAALGLNDAIFDTDQNWVFGDSGPVETAWRRSSNWPFAVQMIAALTKPASYCGKLFDISRMEKTPAGHYAYVETLNSIEKIYSYISPSKLEIYNDFVDSLFVRAEGFGNFIVESRKKKDTLYTSKLKSELANGSFNLVSKVGGFVSKDKLDVILDSSQLGSDNPTPYLPPEDYTVYFNVSNPIKSIAISGLIIVKTGKTFTIRGYDRENQYFKIHTPIHQNFDPVLTIGAKSADYVVWSPNQFYQEGTIVYNDNAYYRVLYSHNSLTKFDTNYYRQLSKLPETSGLSVITANSFEVVETVIPYGVEFSTTQEVYDFIIGYNNWLEKQGFIFDEYSEDFSQVINWQFSSKEFLYWTTQNWANGSVITLSPFAEQLKFVFQEGIVDNIFDSFYEYSLLRGDGLSFPSKNFSLVREKNTFIIKTKNTTEGLFFAKLNIVQKEHMLVFNNKTIFGDVLYQINSGYRQVRLKLKGFRTAEWDGSFFTPGFVFDNASIETWSSYTDYIPSDLVEYVGKYYSAKTKIIGSQNFNFNDWVLLDSKPRSQLLPNFDYKINQFEDFYSLDVDNFDSAQQRMSQHLVGYSPRSYLQNIFPNLISQYKFYQGYIRDKGTKNSLSVLEKASVANLQGKLEFNEEWAFRVGYYGNYSNFNELELPLRERDFIENSQIIQFVDSVPVLQNDLTSYVTPYDLVIKPVDYTPTTSFITFANTSSSNTFVLPDAGYVRLDDVTYSITSATSLLNITDANTIQEGNTFWVGFEPTGSWGVYRYTRLLSFVISVESGEDANTIVFKLNRPHGLSAGQYVSITRFDPNLNGVYKILKITELDKITVSKIVAGGLPTDLPYGIIFGFVPVRFSNVDDISNLPNIADIAENELFWIDDTGSNKWGVLKKINNYTPTEYISERDKPGQQYGRRITKQANSTTMVVSASQFYDVTGGYGRIYIYESISNSVVRVTNYSLNDVADRYRSSLDTAGFGETLFYDDTDELIFAAAPDASNVRSTATGLIRTAELVYPINTATQVGLVKISGIFKGRTASNRELPYTVLVAPEVKPKPRFGKSIFVQRTPGTKRVLIGAPGAFESNTTTNYTGTVYQYVIDVEKNLLFSGVTGTNSAGTGSGAIFDITVNGLDYVVNLVSTGTNYSTDTTIIINGNILGGVQPENNLRIKILSTNTFVASTSSDYGCILNYSSTGTAAQAAFTISTSSQLTLPVYNSFKYDYAPPVGAEFGYKIVGNTQGTVIAVSAPNYYLKVGSTATQFATGAVYIFTATSVSTSSYKWVQTIAAISTSSGVKSIIRPGDRFGTNMEMSDDGNYLFVSSTQMQKPGTRKGAVAVYKWNSNLDNFVFLQLISTPSKEPNMRFGFDISVNSSATILAITSQGTNLFNNVTFDAGLTVIDGSATRFGDTTKNSGTAYIFNRYNQKFLLAQELFDNTVDEGSYYGESVYVDDNTIFVGSPNSIYNNNPDGSIYIWNEIIPQYNSWQLFREQSDLVDISLIKKATTINTMKEQVLDYLDILDPLKGKIPGLADQEIRYKTPFDPAVYNYGDTDNSASVVDSDSNWTTDHIGELWWDLSKVKYIWYEQGDLSYRKNTWGQLFPGASIDVYEWVETEYKPSQWANLADTTEGLTTGISGQPKDGDDTLYSERILFNKNTNQFTTLYYYWVKNRSVIPPNVGRRTAAFEIASLLTNPKTYGLKYLSVIAPDAVVMTNFKSNLISNRIYLNISSNNVESSVNKHTEWLLLQENCEDGLISPLLEKKLLDSLLGKDNLGNEVPDPNLPTRLKYGVEIRPRQSLFVDRLAALRNLIEYTNYVLSITLTRGYFSFKNLNSKEEIPDILLGEYDVLFQNIEGRDTIITQYFVRAELTCEITNGRITAINIVNSGFGYMYAPTVRILNVETSAKIKTIINDIGQIVNVEILDAGSGFIHAPNLLVRAFTCVVETDINFNNKWSSYEWSGTAWDRLHTQKYDTTKYWEYIDWEDSSYSMLKPLDYTVDEIYELQTLPLESGDYIRVNNPGDGKYIILRKTTADVVGSFDANFDIIYSQEGTVQIKSNVYDYKNSQLGFDETTTFDQLLYDESAEIELQKILQAIKEDLFVGPLKIHWNKFFFKAVKYALTEQKFLDWAFKTAFINVKNIAGILDQRSTYRFQDPSWYEDYLKEIKPFHTKIRNYQLNYQVGESSKTPYELTYTYSTDFDVPSYYDTTISAFTTITETTALLETYPYKTWNDNKGFQVDSIELVSQGTGYKITPKIDIIAASDDYPTATATAIAYIAFGKVTEIEITNKGDGYTKTPTVVINGGGDTINAKAMAFAKLSNKKVRNNIIGIKFDRVATRREIGSTVTNYTTITDASSYSYLLPWYSTTNKDDISVYLDGIVVLDTDYSINNYKELFNGYHKKFSDLVFNDLPGKNKTLYVEFKKNIQLYTAADRIEDYYHPESGMPGRDITQLISGAEYPGSRVGGLPFADTAGWDSQAFTDSYWDSNYVTNQIVTTVTNYTVTGTNSSGTYILAIDSITGVSPGQTITVGDKLPLSTVIRTTNVSSATYLNVAAVSTGNYLVTPTAITTYYGVPATINPAFPGSGVTFNVSRRGYSYIDVVAVNSGSNYNLSSTLTISGYLLGGETGTNDITVIVLSTTTNNGISGVRISGLANAVGTTATFLVNRYQTGYTASVISGLTGTNFTTGTRFTIDGALLGGRTVINNFTITVTATNLTGSITGISSTGTAYIGTGSTFNVYRSNSIYSVAIVNSGTGYYTDFDSYSKLTIFGNQLGGFTPENDLIISVLSTSTYQGNITSATVFAGKALSPTITIARPISSTIPSTSTAIIYNFITEDPNLDTIVDGGTISTTSYGMFATAKGINPSDIILDGDGLVTPYNSYAPEEMVPGEVKETIGINVYTRAEKGSPLITTQTYPVKAADTSTTLSLRLTAISTSSAMVTFNRNALTYNNDYTINFINNTLTVNQQIEDGTLAVTVVGLGGSQLLGNVIVTTSNTFQSIIDLGTTYDSIGSIYVTCNGEVISITSSTTLGYTLGTVSEKNRRARLTVKGLGTGTTIIQAWYFESSYKGYSEVKEQIVKITESTSTVKLEQMPGVLGPFHGQAVVEINGLRLIPPDTTYYEVKNNQTTYDIRPDEVSPAGIYDLSKLEVHINGIEVQNAIDFIVVSSVNQIEFFPNILNNGDVIAITILLDSAYKISNGNLILTTPAEVNDILKIITYTNSDASDIRTEVFKVLGSKRFIVSREIIDDNYVWVSVNKVPLISRNDFRILEDNRTIKIHENYPINDGEKVVITTFSNNTVNKVVGYKIFKDVLNVTSYKRIGERNNTSLSMDLKITDTKIFVNNPTALPNPNPAANSPGIVFIDSERIEYFTKEGNALGRLRRATKGTGAKNYYKEGTVVSDQSAAQTIPYTEKTLVETFTTTNVVTTTSYVLTATTFDPNVNPYDQVEVYYGGKLLQKNTSTGFVMYKHNSNLGYDSGENDSDEVRLPDFTITTGTTLVVTTATGLAQRTTGSLIIYPGHLNTGTGVIRVSVVQRIGSTWYHDNGLSLLETITPQAKFLLDNPSGLPKFEFTLIPNTEPEDLRIELESTGVLTDENFNDLEGI